MLFPTGRHEAYNFPDHAIQPHHAKKPIHDLGDGAKRQGETVFVPATHPRWPGRQPGQNILPMAGGFLVSIRTMNNSQRGALGLPCKGAPE